jgi:hypothetical protein
MSGCIDTKVGQLLHDYELGLLSKDDNHRFEMHLYDCDYCLGQVHEFMDVSKILSKDTDARALTEKIAGESGIKKEKKKHSPFLRLLIAAILVAVIVVPVYRYGIYEAPSDAVQTLELLPARTGGSDIIYLDQGGDVSISFFVANGFEGSVDITISKVDGDTVLSLRDFTDFNERGLGTITFPVFDFSEGHYMLQVQPSDTAAAPDRLYMFRVK